MCEIIYMGEKMPRFFVSPSQIGVRDNGEKTVIITGDDALHITKSLRMREGEAVTVCDRRGTDYFCTVEKTGETVFLAVTSEKSGEGEPPYFATVYQALVKGDKFDTVVQKAVECGASAIVPFISERCIVRIDKKDAAKKIVRWQRIAEEAAKQCGRGIIPEILPLMTYIEAVESAAKADIPLFCYEDEGENKLGKILKTAEKHGTVSIMIGSEGGFSEKEADAAKKSGMVSVGLGKRILRTETASSFALSCLSYEFELR